MDTNEEERDRQIEESFRQALERRKLENGIHEPSAEERMPAKIFQKRKINAMTNVWIQIIYAIVESKHCTLREAANFMTETIHKEHEKFLEKQKNKEKFGPLPDEYDPRNDSSVMREE